MTASNKTSEVAPGAGRPSERKSADICLNDQAQRVIYQTPCDPHDLLRRLYYIRNPDNWTDAEEECWADAVENVIVEILSARMSDVQASVETERKRIAMLEAKKHQYIPLTGVELERARVLFQAFKNGDRLFIDDYMLLQRAGYL